MRISIPVLVLILIFATLSEIQGQTAIRSFIFGHSLLDHRPPAIPTPSNETTVPHWLHLLATEAGHTYAAAGQYGFLPQHANLPPFSQWGYDLVQPAWESDYEPFTAADFNNILITAGNFMQWQAPDQPYPYQGGITPISATQDIVNWIDQQEPTAKIYIYENWPDMAGYISNGVFPPTSSDLANYYNYVNADFHDWWIDYQDAMLLSHPNKNIRMIPVGPILANLLTSAPYNQIPVTEIYEDDAPHGRATLYFLASMITYSAIYEEPVPATFVVPNIVHPTIRNNYTSIATTIWNELLAFNDATGDTRVFCTTPPVNPPVDTTSNELCQLDIGTNLAGMADFGTELPFVDLMRNARTWYTKDIGNPNAPFDSEHASHLSYRADGYPTHIPQTIPASAFPQKAVTIWDGTDGWPVGQYSIFWEGTGTLSFITSHQNITYTGSNSAVFEVINPAGGVLELTIAQSNVNDPIHNIRIIMPGHANTYLSEPFNPVWLEKVRLFKTIRFMDWGQTNNWGEGETWNDPSLFDWADRSGMDHYTWAYQKGIPYEMMVKLMNDYGLDGWVCVPHRASNDYISNMAAFFRDNLEPDRHLTVEYSNEIWNWIFGQAQWLNEYGCVQQGVSWPEGLVPYVQNCMDLFTTAYAGQTHRITRAVGAFTGWPAITSTITSSMTPGSFDAIAPTFYFGIPESGDLVLDALGASATTADIAFYARQGMQEAIGDITYHKTDIADPLGVSLKFYEGGQHLTPTPFGVEPTYVQALLDIQRDTAMYHLYTEWFDLLRPLQSGAAPLHLSHFSLVSNRSAQFGSWGMLETMDQDTTVIPAPKFSAILDHLGPCAGAAPEISLWLEGPFDVANNRMSTSLLQLDLLPAGQPYASAPWNYSGTEGQGWTSADYPANTVDWVLVDFRTGPEVASSVLMRSALVLADGSLSFPQPLVDGDFMNVDSVYLVIGHRNHMAVMTPIRLATNSLSYDFRDGDSYVLSTSNGQKEIAPGTWAMFAADGDQTSSTGYEITGSEKILFEAANGNFDIYHPIDFNLNGDINGDDKLIWFYNNGIFSGVEK